MPTKEMFRFKVCRKVSVPVWSVKINILRLFCIASQRVKEKSAVSKLVWCWPPYRKPLAVRKGLHYWQGGWGVGGKMANEHSQDNIQCIYNIVTSNLSSLMVQNKY